MKILVLRPTPIHKGKFGSILPIELGIIQATLKNTDNDITLVDLDLEFENLIQQGICNKNILENDDVDLFLRGKPLSSPSSRLILKLFERVVKALASKLDTDYDLIVNSISYERNRILSLALSKYLSENFGSKVVVGGSMAAYLDFMSFYPFVDFVQKGSISDLILLIDALKNSNSLFEVPSLIFRGENGLLDSKVESKNEYPLLCPDFEGLDFEKYKRLSGKSELIIPYDFISGCPYNCAFCRFCLEQKLSFKSPLEVKNDIEFLKNQTGSSTFYFLNNTLNISENFLIPYLDELERLNILWSDSARPNLISKTLAKKMKQSGCSHLTLGVESILDTDLKYLHKGFTSKNILESIKNCAEEGISCRINLIAGIPFQRLADIKNNIVILDELSKYVDSVLVSRYYTSGEMFSNPSKYSINLEGGMDFSEIGGFDLENSKNEAVLIEDFFEDFFKNKDINVIIFSKSSELLT